MEEYVSRTLISIIVPVYNTENYLGECIDSILAQTFTDWELLLINDGSPDNSSSICDLYAARDSRIKVFHKENDPRGSNQYGSAAEKADLQTRSQKGSWRFPPQNWE